LLRLITPHWVLTIRERHSDLSHFAHPSDDIRSCIAGDWAPSSSIGVFHASIISFASGMDEGRLRELSESRGEFRSDCLSMLQNTCEAHDAQRLEKQFEVEARLCAPRRIAEMD
jgi:hypothetical protein